MTAAVLGVDGCRGGWVAVAWSGAESVLLVFGSDIAAVVGEATRSIGAAPVVVAIDIPIGLPDRGPREADRLTRAALGRRGSTIFATPTRAALEAPTFAEALAISRAVAGIGISAQAYALRSRILEVDAWRRTAPMRVVEVHPELSFAAMAAEPLAEPKKTWAGMVRRRRLLADHGLVISDDAGIAGVRAGVDDLLDAAAAAWSAHRVLTGAADSLPPRPEQFSDGVAAAIWR